MKDSLGSTRRFSTRKLQRRRGLHQREQLPLVEEKRRKGKKFIILSSFAIIVICGFLYQMTSVMHGRFEPGREFKVNKVIFKKQVEQPKRKDLAELTQEKPAPKNQTLKPSLIHTKPERIKKTKLIEKPTNKDLLRREKNGDQSQPPVNKIECAKKIYEKYKTSNIAEVTKTAQACKR